MSASPPALALALLLGSAACSGSSNDDAGVPPSGDATALPDCTEQGVLYSADRFNALTELPAGGDLPVITGFQGFVFVQLHLGSATKPSDEAPFTSRVVVDSLGIDRTSSHAHITSVPEASGWRSDAILLFFNDTPVADLVGHAARITVRAALETCVLGSTRDVMLVNGGVQRLEDIDAGAPD